MVTSNSVSSSNEFDDAITNEFADVESKFEWSDEHVLSLTILLADAAIIIAIIALGLLFA